MSSAACKVETCAKVRKLLPAFNKLLFTIPALLGNCSMVHISTVIKFILPPTPLKKMWFKFADENDD